MSSKALFPGALVLTLASFCTVQGQPLPAPGGGPGVMQPGPSPAQVLPPPNSMDTPAQVLPGPWPMPGPAAPAAPGAPGQSCAWANCNGPVGADGPLCTELYMRNGLNLAYGNNVLARSMDPGWIIEGGARTLFFNPAQDAAWTVDISVNNIANVVHQNVPVTQTFAAINSGMPFVTTMHHLNRTYANLGLGREWYLYGSASDPSGRIWRAGFDADGRWGSARLDLNDYPHRTSVLTGAGLGLHTDVEIPCGWCVVYFGLRAEWGYTFCNVLRGYNSDIEDFNLMATTGIRF